MLERSITLVESVNMRVVSLEALNLYHPSCSLICNVCYVIGGYCGDGKHDMVMDTMFLFELEGNQTKPHSTQP